MEPTDKLLIRNGNTLLTVSYFQQTKETLMEIEDLDCYPEESDGAIVLPESSSRHVLKFFSDWFGTTT